MYIVSDGGAYLSNSIPTRLDDLIRLVATSEFGIISVLGPGPAVIRAKTSVLIRFNALTSKFIDRFHIEAHAMIVYPNNFPALPLSENTVSRDDQVWFPSIAHNLINHVHPSIGEVINIEHTGPRTSAGSFPRFLRLL